jgi:hypothetical protein
MLLLNLMLQLSNQAEEAEEVMFCRIPPTTNPHSTTFVFSKCSDI